MIKTEIACDSCGFDLSDTDNIEDYRLALTSQLIVSTQSVVHCMGAYPAIDKDAHFCGIDCLRDWLSTEYLLSDHPDQCKLGSVAHRRKLSETATPMDWSRLGPKTFRMDHE